MKAADIHGYGEDPDLRSVPADAPVTVEMIDVHDVDEEIAFERDYVKAYAENYTYYGPWALPPVVCIGGGDRLIGGAHRMAAAHRAGLKKIPAFIIDM